MAVALDPAVPRPERAALARTGLIGAAGLASLGAGAVHAAAIGVHAEHRPAALTFTAVATLQLCWGGLALVRSNRLVAAIGAALGAGALAGWVVAKTAGLDVIDGLEEAESIQTADGLAAALAFVTLALATAALLGKARPRLPMSVVSVVVIAVTVVAMVSAGTHAHADGHDGGTETAAHDDHGAGAGGGGNGDGESAAAPADDHGDEHPEGHETAAADPVPYDPSKPIDLGGVEGVTPEQQAAAENLVAVTLLRLPKWSDPAVAEAAGFRSIGDGFTGIEHFVNREFMTDDVILDPDRPESLVFNTEGGGRRLVAAMYMVKPGTPLEDVPNVGGDLMQWHTHENLCYNAQGKVAGITDAEGNCPAGLVKPVETPMIHVWIESHPCGPFAALEGIGGGRILEGEERLCDHAHGAPA